jgi:hypothetical protein
MMGDLFELGFIQLKELAFHPPQGSEFYITLSRQGHLPGARDWNCWGKFFANNRPPESH